MSINNSSEDLLICGACYNRKNPLQYVKILDYFASMEEKVK
jgi:hypothetical protein